MLILTADGELPEQHASWEIEKGRTLLLGRSRTSDCPVPWDPRVSRKHARVFARGNRVTIYCLPEVSNLIWRNGISCMETQLAPGESIRIGQTTFELTERRKQALIVDIVDEQEDGKRTTSVMMSSADVRLSVVSRHAPTLWSSVDDESLAEASLEILEQALNEASLFVVLSCDDQDRTARPGVVGWRMAPSEVKPIVGREVVAQAISSESAVMMVETREDGSPAESGRWSLCVPVRSDASPMWCFYVSGTYGPDLPYESFLTPEKLKPDVVVTELVSHLAGAVRSVRTMESRVEGVRRFFSPQVLEKVLGPDASESALAPRETDITALYCDLRGFSRMVSQSSGDLHGLLERISEALGIMTRTMIAHQGVIADFQGDSALGFWGWPLALTDGPLPACRAALQIRDFFVRANEVSRGGLKGFHVGIGIATGRAIAGRIGTQDHAKIGVFGPVVNIASRLEGLTRPTGASILMDEVTALAAQEGLHAEEGRCRPLGTLLPVGFDDPVQVSELLPPVTDCPISDDDIRTFADAVAAFQAGDWDRCRKKLAHLPAEDRPRDFLLVQIASHNHRPPADWDGVIRLDSK